MISIRTNTPPRAPSADLYPPLDKILDRRGRDSALRLFRSGLDSVEIAWRLECTPAAAANGIARAREDERKAAA